MRASGLDAFAIISVRCVFERERERERGERGGGGGGGVRNWEEINRDSVSL
jgi:hypothetical protein